MSLFRKKTPPAPAPLFPPEQFEPVIRSSICTGEKTACMRNRETGKLHEVMLIRTPAELEQFKETYGISGEIEKIY